MNAVSHNLRGGLLSRSMFSIVLAGVGLFSLAGVTLPPALSILEARSSIDSEEQRVISVVDLRHRVESFVAAGGPEVAERILERLGDVLPREIDGIEVFSMLRFCAHGAGFDIQSLHLGGTLDLGLRSAQDQVELLELNLVGEARIESLLRLLQLIEAQGYPVAVLDLALQRSTNRSGYFQIRTSLGALYFAPLSNSSASELESP